MRRLQVLVRAIEGVAITVLRERADLRAVGGAGVAARGVELAGTVLVDVVAEVHHEAQVLLGHVAVRRVVAVLVLLAGAKAKVDPEMEAPAPGAVLVLPVGLASEPTLKR